MSNRIQKIFLINQDIEFRPSDNLLYSRTTQAELKIFSTASRCLVCMLDNPDKIVSQNDLFCAGWGKAKAKEITPNALYQNIMEIRRKTKALGMDNSFIETVSRKGWKVTKGTTIEFIDYHIADRSDLPIAPRECSIELKAKGSYFKNFWGTLSYRILFVLLFILSCATFIFINSSTHAVYGDNSLRYLDNYNKITTIDKCILSSRSISYVDSLYLFNRYYNRSHCQNEHSIFMTLTHSQVSFITCTIDKSVLVNCLTQINLIRTAYE